MATKKFGDDQRGDNAVVMASIIARRALHARFTVGQKALHEGRICASREMNRADGASHCPAQGSFGRFRLDRATHHPPESGGN